MGGQSLFASPLDLWKERRLSASTCGSFMTHSPASTTGSHDIESVYTSRSSVSSMRSRDRTRSRSLASHVDSRLSLPVFEEGDERLSMPTNAVVPVGDEAAPLPSPPAKMFTSYNVRVWKQTPHATWMNVFVPRHVRLQTGSHPFIEYSRQENGVIRQRVYLTTATMVDRLPKNKLQIEFKNTDAAVSIDVKQAKQWIEDEAVMATPKTTSCNSDKWVLRFETKQERDQWAKRLQDTIDLLAWISKFTVGQVIIESGASTLAECYSWLDQGQPSFIMKAMATSTKNLIATARQEIRIHHLLTNFSSHPNVLALHDSFRQQERAYLVLEYCSGGDLFEHIHKEGALDETTAKALFRRIADAIAYIHEQNVVHLDIKPENLLFQSSPMNPETIKLADFGSAQLLADPSGLIKSTVSCTIGYAAPEVLDSGDVSFAADVFSAGAVLYTMLCGFAPFQSPSDEESLERTLRGDFSFDDPEWMTVSAQAKDLICGMLEVDPRERLSMEEVLGHPWLK